MKLQIPLLIEPLHYGIKLTTRFHNQLPLLGLSKKLFDGYYRTLNLVLLQFRIFISN